MKRTEKWFLSLVFIAFWSMCLIQVFNYREDYPFSFFGMYKGMNVPGEFRTFRMRAYINGIMINYNDFVDPFHTQKILNEIVLKERSLKTRYTIKSSQLLNSEISPNQYEKLSQFFRNEVIPKMKTSKFDSIKIQVRYLQWDRLTQKKLHIPDIDRIVFEKNYSGVQDEAI